MLYAQQNPWIVFFLALDQSYRVVILHPDISGNGCHADRENGHPHLEAFDVASERSHGVPASHCCSFRGNCSQTKIVFLFQTICRNFEIKSLHQEVDLTEGKNTPTS